MSSFLEKKHFRKNRFFRIYDDFEADSEKDKSSKGNKTINIIEKNPVYNGYYIVSELDGLLKSGYSESPICYDRINWFVDEVIKIENKMTFYFKNTNKDIVMTEEDKEHSRNGQYCQFCEKQTISDQVRDHRHSTDNYRGPAHQSGNVNVTQKQNKFVPFVFHNFSHYDCHVVFKMLVDKKYDKVKFDFMLKNKRRIYISDIWMY